MTTEQLPITPRDALLAFAGYLDNHPMPAPLPSSVYAELARNYAEDYYSDPEPEPFTSAPPGAGPNRIENVWTDVTIRAQALQSAAMVHAEQRTPSHIVIADARFFERYLRGDQ